jgi:hypothetical protein
MRPLPGNKPLVEAIQKHGEALFGRKIPAMGTPLYTDVRLYAEAGIPGVIYGAGPRTVLESHAKRADERLDLEDLRRATKVIARTLRDLLAWPDSRGNHGRKNPAKTGEPGATSPKIAARRAAEEAAAHQARHCFC